MNIKVDIYFNLHKKCLSIRHKGKVIGHAKSAELSDVSFVVSQRGRERVLREKRKNVHALVRGQLQSFVALNDTNTLTVPINESFQQVKYNPYKYSSFVMASNEQPIYRAESVSIYNKAILVK